MSGYQRPASATSVQVTPQLARSLAPYFETPTQSAPLSARGGRPASAHVTPAPPPSKPATQGRQSGRTKAARVPPVGPNSTFTAMAGLSVKQAARFTKPGSALGWSRPTQDEWTLLRAMEADIARHRDQDAFRKQITSPNAPSDGMNDADRLICTSFDRAAQLQSLVDDLGSHYASLRSDGQSVTASDIPAVQCYCRQAAEADKSALRAEDESSGVFALLDPFAANHNSSKSPPEGTQCACKQARQHFTGRLIDALVRIKTLSALECRASEIKSAEGQGETPLDNIEISRFVQQCRAHGVAVDPREIIAQARLASAYLESGAVMACVSHATEAMQQCNAAAQALGLKSLDINLQPEQALWTARSASGEPSSRPASGIHIPTLKLPVNGAYIDDDDIGIVDDTTDDVHEIELARGRPLSSRRSQSAQSAQSVRPVWRHAGPTSNLKSSIATEQALKSGRAVSPTKRPLSAIIIPQTTSPQHSPARASSAPRRSPSASTGRVSVASRLSSARKLADVPPVNLSPEELRAARRDRAIWMWLCGASTSADSVIVSHVGARSAQDCGNIRTTLLLLLAKCASVAGRSQDALALIGQASSAIPTSDIRSAQVMMLRAEVLRSAGDLKECVNALEECWALCEAQPTWGRAHGRMVPLYLALGRIQIQQAAVSIARRRQLKSDELVQWSPLPALLGRSSSLTEAAVAYFNVESADVQKSQAEEEVLLNKALDMLRAAVDTSGTDSAWWSADALFHMMTAHMLMVELHRDAKGNLVFSNAAEHIKAAHQFLARAHAAVGALELAAPLLERRRAQQHWLVSSGSKLENSPQDVAPSSVLHLFGRSTNLLDVNKAEASSTMNQTDLSLCSCGRNCSSFSASQSCWRYLRHVCVARVKMELTSVQVSSVLCHRARLQLWSLMSESAELAEVGDYLRSQLHRLHRQSPHVAQFHSLVVLSTSQLHFLPPMKSSSTNDDYHEETWDDVDSSKRPQSARLTSPSKKRPAASTGSAWSKPMDSDCDARTCRCIEELEQDPVQDQQVTVDEIWASFAANDEYIELWILLSAVHGKAGEWKLAHIAARRAWKLLSYRPTDQRRDRLAETMRMCFDQLNVGARSLEAQAANDLRNAAFLKQFNSSATSVAVAAAPSTKAAALPEPSPRVRPGSARVFEGDSWIPSPETITPGDHVLAFWQSPDLRQSRSGWWPARAINIKGHAVIVEFEPEINVSTGKFMTASATRTRHRQLVPRVLVTLALARRAAPSAPLAMAAHAIPASKIMSVHTAVAIDDNLKQLRADHGHGSITKFEQSSLLNLRNKEPPVVAPWERDDFSSLIPSDVARTFEASFGFEAAHMPILAEAARLGWEPVDVLSRSPADGRLRVVFRADRCTAEVREEPRSFWRMSASGSAGVDTTYLTIARRTVSGETQTPYWASEMCATATAQAEQQYFAGQGNSRRRSSVMGT